MEKKDLTPVISLLKKSRLPIDHILDENNYFVVAKFQDRVIGCGCFTFYKNFVEIRSIAVKKRFKMQGIRSKIVKYLFQQANDRGISLIYLRTSLINKDFFLKLGFKELPQEMLLDLFDKCKSCERYVNKKCDMILMNIDL